MSSEGDEQQPRPPRRLVAALAGIVVIVAAAGYAWRGSPAMLARLDPPDRAEQMATLVDQLAAHLQKQPDDGRGWAMLARSYVALDRKADALAAYAKAQVLLGDDADLLADHAEAMAASEGGSLDGQSIDLVERALAVNPRHPKALLLAGSAAFARSDYAGAASRWEQAIDGLPDDDAAAKQVRVAIAEARKRGGLAPSPPQGGERGRLGVPADSQPPREPPRLASRGVERVGVRGEAISGTVTLAPALAAKVEPNDTVFVFARAASGPRMPLAILRKRARDLPLDFRLDDSLAMGPQAKLSAFDQVIVGARISKSGEATPRPGDLVGQSAPVAPGASALRIEIGETVGP